MNQLVRFARRRFTAIVAAIAVVQSLLLLALKPGALSIDEVAYQAMTRGVSHGTFAIANGLDIASSPELESPLVKEVAGRLLSQYPEGYAVIGAPIYSLLGVGGLFLLNSLSFFATVLLCRAIAFEVTRKKGAALLAAAIFALGTFAWEYGIAVWPHALGMLLTTAAFHLVLRGSRQSSPARARAQLLLAGFLAGIAATLRLDCAFMLPALLLTPALVRSSATHLEPSPTAPMHTARATFAAAMTVLVGTLPALAFLCVVNHAKFGTWQPFYYGPWQPSDGNSGVAQYVPLGVLALAGLVAFHVLLPRRPTLRRAHLIGAAACVVVALVVPVSRAALLRFIDGVWQLVFDLRHRDMGWAEGALTRSPRGAMIYVDTFKTSLLQSCPFLPVVLFSFVGRSAEPAARLRRLAVLVPVALYVSVYSWFRWHGGLSVNLRYFVPILPFVAVLSADGISRLARRCAPVIRAARVSDFLVLAAIAAYMGALTILQVPVARRSLQEIFYLDAPLALAALLASTTVLAISLRPGRIRARVAAIAFTLAVAGIVWGGLTELTYHVIAVLRVRGRGHMVVAQARRLVPKGAVIIADYPDPVAGLLEDSDIIVNGSQDDFADTPRLVAASTCLGHRSFAVMRRGAWGKLSARFVPTDLSGVVLRDGDHPDLVIAELAPARGEACAQHRPER